ncbi:MAG: glycosyltransferase [Clostridiales bacterium]|jgi:glycosyltransferase involved in cell wall biosynthesis|nr:glycosyltransferase [Clostridiales bacterium]
MENVLYLINHAGQAGSEQYVLSLIEAAGGHGFSPRFAYNEGGPLSEKAAALGVPSARIEMRGPFDLRAARRLGEYCRAARIGVVHTGFLRENYVALLAKRLFCRRLKVVYTNHVMLRNPPQIRAANRLMTRGNHRIIAVCGAARDRLIENGNAAARIAVIHNAVEPAKWRPGAGSAEAGAAARGKYSIGRDAFVLLCASRFSPEKGHAFLLDALAMLLAGTAGANGGGANSGGTAGANGGVAGANGGADAAGAASAANAADGMACGTAGALGCASGPNGGGDTAGAKGGGAAGANGGGATGANGGVAGANGGICLLLAGDGPLLGDVKARAERLGLGGMVRFAGHVGDMRPLYYASDACACPSESEASSYMILEAMACGLPVIASDRGGNGELVNEGYGNGLLVEYGDAAALMGAISALCGDAALRRAMGERALVAVEERFGLEQMLERTFAAYR